LGGFPTDDGSVENAGFGRCGWEGAAAMAVVIWTKIKTLDNATTTQKTRKPKTL
jgi:hypothetical protein